MENHNKDLVDCLVRNIPRDVLDRLQRLSRQDFDRFLSNVKESSERDNVCNICGKHFTQKRNLTQHMKLHDESAFKKCVDCTYKTTINSHLQRHMKAKKHGPFKQKDNNDDSTSGQPLQKRAKTDTDSVKTHKLRKTNYQSSQPDQDTPDITALKGNTDVFEIRPTSDDHIPKQNSDRDLSNVKEGLERENVCNVCGKHFTQKKNLTQHMKLHDESAFKKCVDCTYKTTINSHLQRHMKAKKHGPFKQKDNNDDNTSGQPLQKRAKTDTDGAKTQKRTKTDSCSSHPDQDTPAITAIRNNAEVFEIRPSSDDQRYDLIQFLKENQERIKNILMERSSGSNIKFYFNVQVKMVKYDPDGSYEESRPHFRSNVKTVLQTTDDLEYDMNESFQKIFTSMEEFLKNGSGYQLEEVLQLDVTITKYTPLSGSSYFPMPATLSNSHSLVNVKNTEDNQCFMWSILACLHPSEHNPERVENYFPYTNNINLSGMDFPTPLSQLRKFECQNGQISLNVFGFESGEIYPLYITKKTYCQFHVNLLYIKNEDNTHYVWIKNFNRFLFRTKTHHGKRFFCHYCLQGFTEDKKLQTHIEDCRMFKPQKISLPPPGHVLEFKEFSKIQRHPFAIYADFECFTRKIDTCQPDPETGGTHRYQQMDAYSYAYQRVCTDKRYDKPMVVYRGPDPVEHFLKNLMKEEEEIMRIMTRTEPMVVNDFVKMEYNEATTCYVCRKPFGPKNHKVIDHDHVTGDVRGIACNNCNLQMKVPNFIPIVLHNLSGFDANLIMKSIGKFKESDIKVIPYNKERYLSFSLGRLRFIDSLHFLNDSLATLTTNLAQEGDEHFKCLWKCFPNPDLFPKLMSKQFFPYDYLSDERKLQDTRLPSREAFHNKLTNEDINEEDYAFAQDIWKAMGIQTLGEYSDMYLKTDVALLADIFERFRDICLNDYELDPIMYFTLPSYSWSAMMRYTGIVLDAITDANMVVFLEKGVRGGVSSCFKRYSKANNMYLDDKFDPEKASTYIGFFDAVNLYGKSMTEPLPYGNFEWLTEKEIDNLKIEDLSPDAKEGYFLEVDLEYPHHLHDSHSDYPLAPEKLTVTTEDLSPYSRTLLKDLYGKDTLGKCEKLIPNLYDKEKYIIHYRNLQLYTNLGMKLKKIHRAIRFNQSRWLAPYIDFNSFKRKHARSSFERSLYKLMNNSIFGRSLMNTRNHVDVKLCHTEKKLLKHTAKPSYKSCQIFCEDLVAVENVRTNILMCQPIYIGFSILDLSKYVMYDFHYNYMKPLYKDRIRVLYTDTDSMIYEIETLDMYEDIKDNMHLFDTSEYPPEHFCYSTQNMKVLGKFKDEVKSKAIMEFISLRAKMYSVKLEDGEKHAAKGISKSVSKTLKHQMYKDCLLEKTTTKCQMNMIRADGHTIYTQTVQKKCLVPFDDKRWILDDGITTRAYGHKDNNK